MNNQPHHSDTTTEPKAGVANSVLSRIKAEHIAPTPRWYFVFSECTMWSLWLVSILVGAVAVAVTIYVSVHASYAFYEATHDTLFDFIADIAPVLWLSLFVLMAGLAYFNVRHTKKGYRYPVWQIIASSFVFSVLGGSALHLVGGGFMVDTMLARTMPMYSSLEKIERDMWLDPDDGRLVGHFVASESATQTTNFVDVENTAWVVNTDELLPPDREALVTGGLVKMVGVMSTSSEGEFYSCGVFPWQPEERLTIGEMRRQKREFVDRLAIHADRLERGRDDTMLAMNPVEEDSASLLTLEQGADVDVAVNNDVVAMKVGVGLELASEVADDVVGDLADEAGDEATSALFMMAAPAPAAAKAAPAVKCPQLPLVRKLHPRLAE